MPRRVVVETRLRVGTKLTRPVVRELRRALRRSEAVGHAERLLASSERSSARLMDSLEQRGVPPQTRRMLLEELKVAGFVSDARAAATRAHSLADRGWADVAILAHLSDEGYDEETSRDAITTLQDEVARARTALARKERTPLQAARFLIQRGFDPELTEELLDTNAFLES